MSILDPERAMQALEEGTVRSVDTFFPLVGKSHTLVAKSIYPDKGRDIDDIASQKRARLRGRTWSTGIYGDFDLVDNSSGKVIDSVKKMKLLSLPKMTRRFSYIVDGTEYQADHQWRLKSGAYARVKANGELETQFNLARGRGFRLDFAPGKKSFSLKYGTTNVPLLPVLQALGVKDEDVRSAWGASLYAAAAVSKKRGGMARLAKILDRKSDPKSDADAAVVIKDALAETELSPDTTKITLGQAFKSVTGGALLAAANKLLGISRGTEEPDNRDSLRFKELWGTQDHIPERLLNSKRRIGYKLRNNLDRRDSVKAIVTPDIFNVPVKAFFTSTSLSQQSSQVNPVDMVGGFLRTTIMGQGGISNEQAVSEDAKLIDSSHLGFIDPVHTPEGKRSGISSHLTLGVSKDGVNPTIRVYDVKNKKFVQMSPTGLAGKALAFPDQYDFKKGIPTPRKKTVTVVKKDGGDPENVLAVDVDYVLQSSKQLFSITANLVPFLPSDQANRAGMATRHMEQSVSLKHREAPLVQVASGNPSEHLDTWEKIVGRLNSHNSPVSGVVESVSSQRIVVTDKSGEKHTIQLYDAFPLNEKKAFISSAATVKKGDTVKKGEIVADTNFTKGGTLALGVNLNIGYLPYKGLVFEDGIVVSEGAAKKLTSEHLHKNRAYVEKNMSVGLKRFRANYPGAITDENAAKLDDDGVIEKGQMVAPGDTLITVLQKTEPSKEQLLLKGIHKSLVRPFKNRAVVWDKPYVGFVTDVVRNGREIAVHVKTEEPADVGDKLSGRHGNKGVITAVIPDEEMPKDAEGVPLEIIVNPSGVPGRINPGQILETALAKAAYKRGKAYAVDNFQRDDEKKIITVKAHYRTIKTKEGPKRVYVKEHERELGYQEVVAAIVKSEGVSETDELFDGETGKSLGKVLVGKQYILKALHQVDKKLSARAHGYGYDYDANLSPKSGGKGSAGRFGELGLYAMLAHGATANIRDALTYKSDKAQDEVWTAIQTGSILPAPKPSFAYEKFLAYLTALGVNVEKEGNGLIISPLTDKQIREISNGEIKDGSRVIRGKDLKPEKGGLFDEDVTGGPGGKNWAHLRLSEDLPNPMFEKSITSLLGITGKQYDSIISGSAGFDDEGEYTEEDPRSSGPKAIVEQLKEIDVEASLAAAKEKIQVVSKSQLDRVNKKIKYLLMLKKNKMRPEEAYVLSNLPVIPPVFRPISTMEGGDLNIDGLNMLYRDIAILNNKLKEAKGVLPDEAVAGLKSDLYSAIDALYGTLPNSTEGETGLDGQIRPPGILKILSGRNSPKQSYFHKRMMDRRQDISLRSVIVPNMDLHLDEIGIPRKGAMQIFRPFVVKELVKMGYTPLQAREEIEKKTTLANKALDIAVSQRPVLFKRDPVLHKFGVMGFMAKLHDKSSIHIHPLVTEGFNADFDGDTMAVFVPVSAEAVDEAYKMFPSKNLYNPATGRVMYQPSLEGQLGLFLLTRFGKKTDDVFEDEKSAIAAAKNGDISMTDQVMVDGVRTTAGRLSFLNALPKSIRTEELLTDPDAVVGKKKLQQVLRTLAKKAPGDFANSVDKIKSLGFGYAYSTGFSFSLDDFTTLRGIRDKHLANAAPVEARIRKQQKMKMLSDEAADKKVVDLYAKTTKDINADAIKVLKKSGNKLFAMHQAGVKPGWLQLQQLVLAPMLMENAKGRIIPVPVTKSYSEGLSTSGYWVASSGARKGLIARVLSTAIPGVLNKQLANTLMPYVVTANNCGTTKGIALDINDSGVVDRFTAKSVRAGKTTIPANVAITPNLISKMKAAKISKVVVRSPLKCESAKGLCSKCYGVADNGRPLEIGTNIGLIAGSALGERGAQLAMRVFHTGGVAGGGGEVVGSIDRVSQLLKLPAVLPNAAALSPSTGSVESVSKSPAGGFDLKIGGQEVYVPGGRGLLVKKGDKVRRGQKVSAGVINPRQLLELTNVDTVQRYMADELHKVYASEGIKRRNAEVVVKALTNLGRVEDPGDVDGFIRGDYVSISAINAANKKPGVKKPMVVEPVLRGIETLPLDQTTDWIARLQYRKLKETYIRAANEGWESDIHGLHPSPGLAYSAEFGKSEKGPY